MTHADKLQAAKDSMGKAYLFHPNNQVKRLVPFKKTAKQLREALRLSPLSSRTR